jgi:plastocyanin
MPSRLLALACVLALVPIVPASLRAQDAPQARPSVETLIGTVRANATIDLRHADGSLVTQLAAGSYSIEVHDETSSHNFHLSGPGVNQSTAVEYSGVSTWSVTFTAGTYTYVCDPHQGEMKGSFTVGNVTTTPPATPPSSAVTPKTKLALTSGPGYTITLATAAGKKVRTMRTGTYTVVVRDRSAIHNAHLVGPGANRFTTVPYKGTRTWKVKLARAGTLQFLCDPHARQGMRGSAKVIR